MAVRRRAVRAEKYKRRFLYAALFAVLAAAAGLAVFLRREAPIPVIDRKADTSVTFSNRDPADVRSVTVENSTGVYTVTQQEGVCVLDGRPDFVFSESMLAYFLQNAALVYAEETLLDTAGSGYTFADFGLEDGAIRVEAAYADGTNLAFRIGNLLPQETPLYYLRVEGDSRVFSVSQDVQETYMMSADALHRVTDPAVKSELIEKIDFAGENPFTLALEGNEWYLTKPFRYPLSTAKVNALLDKLAGLRFAQYVSPAENADLAACGLSPARRTVTLGIAQSILTGYDENGQPVASKPLPAYDLTFDCGDDIGDVLFYCLYRGDVVKATQFSSGVLLSQGYDSLLQTAPFAVSVSELTRLEWEENGQLRAFDLTLHERVLPNNDFETDDSGNILYDVRVWRDGAQIDESQFLLAYSRLIDVQTLDALPEGYEITGEAAVTVRLFRGEQVRQVQFYPCGELQYAAQVDGVTLFAVSRDKLAAVALPE